jgi:Ser/Thr protein kinase RdoA (MazF antagonist)
MSDDFDLLPLEVQLEKLTRIAVSASERLAFTAIEPRLIKYRENAVFEIANDAGQRGVLRVHRHGYRTEAELCSELAWMDALRVKGIETPPILQTEDGDRVLMIDSAGVERACTALGWVEGEPPEDDLVESFRLVGSAAARIHDHGAGWTPPAWFSRPTLDERSIFGPGAVWGDFAQLAALETEQRKLLVRAADAVRSLLCRFEKTDASWGLIHADLMPDNLLQHGDNLRIIDFDDCGFSWFVNDLATALAMRLNHPLIEDLQGAWLEGYREVRILPEEQLDFLPALLMARLLQFLGWGHTRPNSPIVCELLGPMVDGACAFAEDFLNAQ